MPHPTLFDTARTLIHQQDNAAPLRNHGAESSFALPEADLHAQELFVAAAHAMNPRLSQFDACMHRHVEFAQAYDKFPVQQMLAKLEHIKQGIGQAMVADETGLHFARPADGSFDIDWVLRAALPYPTPIHMVYDLGERQYRNGHGQLVSGEVSHEQLIDLKETAERENHYEALEEICALPCIRASVDRQYAPQLKHALGLTEHGLRR